MTKHIGPRWAYSLELAIAIFVLGAVIAVASCLNGCGPAGAATAISIANGARTATCLVCRKLEQLGVCDAPPDAGTP